MNCILQGQIKGANKELSNLSNYQRALKNIGGRPNRNLLNNWYFVGGGSQQGGEQFPINKRGKVSYGTNVPAFDRWITTTDCSSLTIEQDGITCNAIIANQYPLMSNLNLDYSILAGRQVTVSALIDDDLISATGVIPVEKPESNLATMVLSSSGGSYDVGCSYIAQNDSVRFGFYARIASASAKFKAAKLELGPTQTLAYQDESDNWKLFEIPDYVTEYVYCASFDDDGSYLGIARGLGVRVNKNLLDNCNFAIWQRYPEGTFTGIPNNSYLADRFTVTSSNGSSPNTIERAEGGGIKLVSGPNCVLRYKMENTERFNGRTLTLSTLASNGLFTKTITASGLTGTIDILNQFADNSLNWITTGRTIYAMKLELGPTQTLAYQDEDGNWQLFETPDYGEELAKCQRYYEYTPIYTGFTVGASGTILDMLLYQWIQSFWCSTTPKQSCAVYIYCISRFIRGDTMDDIIETPEEITLESYHVYVQTDDQGRITIINSNIFILTN